jgi:hypothetical protein
VQILIKIFTITPAKAKARERQFAKFAILIMSLVTVIDFALLVLLLDLHM